MKKGMLVKGGMLVGIVALVFSFSCPQSAVAEQGKEFQEPALLTSAGRSKDAVIIKGLCARIGLDVKYDIAAEVADLEGCKSIIFVAGGSSKGLGDAGVDKDAELERIASLVEAAKEKNIPVLTLHIGGEDRRGALSDAFISPAAESADSLGVVKSGNADSFFTAIAEKKGSKLDQVENMGDIVSVLKAVYKK